jgi:hypothetical protein
MKTVLVISAVFAGSAASMVAILFLGIRKKIPAFPLGLLWAVAAVLVAGLGFRALPEKKVLELCIFALAWGFGAFIPCAIVARTVLRPLVVKSRLGKEEPNQPPEPMPLKRHGSP